ncbi:MAG: hypothetical protein U0X40_05235 [Ferruginibacter sp.]
MKKILAFAAALFLLSPAFAQSIYRITLTGTGTIEAIAFEVEPDVIVNISPEGTIINWGFDVYKNRGGENYSNQYQPYAGRVEYYTDNDNEAFRGKIKYIGRTQFTWYASYDGDAFKGKLKSIGSSAIEYFDNYEDPAYRGKIKRIGINDFTWYASYNNEAVKGKLKSVGPTNINYYPSTADKAYQGKVQSINGSAFTYYSSFDLPQYSGAMKTGSQLLMANGIKYFVRN